MIDVRDRLTEGMNRARFKLETRRAAGPLIVTLIGVGIGAALAAWGINNVSKVALSSTQTVRFAVDDASAVVPGRNQARFKGIPAGQITDVDLVDHRAVMTIELQKKYGPIYRNARAELRPDTPVEDMHLDIVDRGDPSAGEADADHPIAPSQTSTQVQIEDVLDTFQPNVRRRFRTLLDNLGNGLKDRGAALRQAFVEVMPLLKAAHRLSSQLSLRNKRVRQLVHNSAELTAELGRRERELRTLVTTGAETFSAVQQQRGELDATLHELAATLKEADSSLAAVNGIVGDVDLAVSRLRPVADRLPSGLSDIRALSASLGPAVRRLRPSVHRLVPLSKSLVPLSQRLASSFRTLRPQLPAIDHVTDKLSACREGAAKFFLWQPTTGVFDDKRGPMPRADVQLTAQSNGYVNTPRRYAAPACNGAVGRIVGGRPTEEKDKR